MVAVEMIVGNVKAISNDRCWLRVSKKSLVRLGVL
jgi:hypothetical protein